MNANILVYIIGVLMTIALICYVYLKAQEAKKIKEEKRELEKQIELEKPKEVKSIEVKEEKDCEKEDCGCKE